VLVCCATLISRQYRYLPFRFDIQTATGIIKTGDITTVAAASRPRLTADCTPAEATRILSTGSNAALTRCRQSDALAGASALFYPPPGEAVNPFHILTAPDKQYHHRELLASLPQTITCIGQKKNSSGKVLRENAETCDFPEERRAKPYRFG